MSGDLKFDYVDISNGRFFCNRHGGFCDERDGYSGKCPLCEPAEVAGLFAINPVHRTLRVINGLQERSKRSVGLVSAIAGGVGFLTLLKQVNLNAPATNSSASTFAILSLSPQTLSESLMVLAIVFLLAAIAFFASSMSQVPVVKYGEIRSRSIEEWKQYLVLHLGKMEKLHQIGGRCLVIGVILMASIPAFALIQAFYKALCS